MLIGGFVHKSHDSGLAIINEAGDIVFAASSERYVQRKSWRDLDENLKQKLNECDIRVFYEDLTSPFALAYFNRHREDLHAPQVLNLTDICADHHRSHAAASFYTRPWNSYDDTVILTIDGAGVDYVTANNIYTYNDKTNRFDSHHHDFKSIGHCYQDVGNAIHINFPELKLGRAGRVSREEGSVMGLASFGNPLDTLYNFIDRIHNDIYYMEYENLTDDKMRWRHKYGGYFDRRSQLYMRKNFWINFKPEDIAATVQKWAEDRVIEYAKIARKYGSKLCFSGGVANNIIINSMLTKIFDDVWIVPGPGDEGSSLGAAAFGWGKETGKNKLNWVDAYLGYNIKREVNPKEVVNYILKHKVCGIANGQAEFGPRALGNRSLIGDVRYDIKDTVNAIKKRQPWRPFGPVILEEEFDNWFEGPTNRYMQFVCKPKHDIKSVIHVDGTSRVQTVPANSRSIIRPILEEYFERTGIPMLLNTSLNVKGRPMVNDENHAELFEQKYDVKVF